MTATKPAAEPAATDADWQAAADAPAVQPVPYPVQFDLILAEHPEWRYLFDHTLPLRPATEDELAAYADRAANPLWADLYNPAPANYDLIGTQS